MVPSSLQHCFLSLAAHVITQGLVRAEQLDRKPSRALLSAVLSSGLSGKECNDCTVIIACQGPGAEEVAYLVGISWYLLPRWALVSSFLFFQGLFSMGMRKCNCLISEVNR